MTKAEELYCGEAGTAYWIRNLPRLVGERWDRARALRRLIPDVEQHPALEIGCGRGFNLVPGDVGLDCDVRQLAYLPDGVIPIVGHAYDLSMFPDGAFPLVMSVGCLMHLPDLRRHWDEMPLMVDTSWQHAAAEIARVSSQYVLLGEYWAEQEQEILGHNWDHCLWARPYTVPGMRKIKQVSPLLPFDRDIVFLVWEKL